MKKRLLFVLIPVVILVAAAILRESLAGKVTAGAECYAAGDYTGAVKWYTLVARAGNADAMNRLGWMYSMFAIGYMLQFPLEGESDQEAALKWYHKAAEQGYGDAMELIGCCYEKGQY